VSGGNQFSSTGGTVTARNLGSAASALIWRFTGDGFTFANNIVLDRGSNLGTCRLDLLTDNPAGTQTFGGVISGNGDVRRASAGVGTGGKTELSGASTYTGGTVVNGGYIALGASSVGPAGALVSGPIGTGPLTFGSGGADDPTVGLYAVAAPRTIANSIVFNGLLTLQLPGSQPLTLAGPVSLGSDTRTFQVDSSAPVTLSNTISGGDDESGLTKDGAGTLILSGVNTYTGNTTVINGKLVLGQSLTTSPLITLQNSAVVELSPTGNGTSVLQTVGIVLGASNKIDVQNNKLVTADPVGSWNGSTYTDVAGLIRSGRNGGGWTGSGIVTSQSSATGGNFTSIGIATAAQVKGISATDTTLWAGQTVSGSDTLVMYTYGGDANLDGKINVDDYGRIDSNIGLGTRGWYNGDFNYDGKVNVDDYGIIDSNIGVQGPPFSTGVGSGADNLTVTAVPEPAAISSFSLAAAVFLRRRRGSSKRDV
jgi:autotransporter-associated beta strand protein